MLEIARALSEQVNWNALGERVAAAPFGAAFLTLAERLEIAPAEPAWIAGRPRGKRAEPRAPCTWRRPRGVEIPLEG